MRKPAASWLCAPARRAMRSRPRTTATDGAPPFTLIAKTNRERPAWIRGRLMSPHPPMPNISLSRQQIDDIVAYLGTIPTQ